MSTVTTELPLKLAAPAVSDGDVDRLCDWLAGNGWLKASQLCAQLGIDDRTLRAIASASKGRILSGQRGYRLFDASVTRAEVEESTGRLYSQGMDMLRRAQDQWRRYHSLGAEA